MLVDLLSSSYLPLIDLQVSYQDVVGPAEVHVDLMGEGGKWMGGGMLAITDAQGIALVPTEIRVPHNYEGELTLTASLTSPGGKAKLSTAQSVTVTIDPAPINAIGVLCQPTQVSPGRTFNLNLWYTQTHAKVNKVIAVALNADTKEYYGGFEIDITEQQVRAGQL